MCHLPGILGVLSQLFRRAGFNLLEMISAISLNHFNTLIL